jgi:hypothetical protein
MIIDKKIHYLRNNKETGGQGKLNEWFLSKEENDNRFLNITAERYIIDYLRLKNSNIVDNLRRQGVDAELDCGNRRVGIEVTTLNGFIAAWIFQERLLEYFERKGFNTKGKISIQYNVERIKNEEQKKNIYNYIENVANAIIGDDFNFLNNLEIKINIKKGRNFCIIWKHNKDKNYPWHRYLTDTLLEKFNEKGKRRQLMKNKRNIIFVGVNEFAPSNWAIPRIFREIGCGGISYQNEIDRIEKFWSNSNIPQYITGICYFYYSLDREDSFYPLKIFWRNEKEKIKMNL